MATKPLDRLLFAQGGMCFFCKEPLPKNEASVEHLLASSRGGANSDDNCVACCKALNALLGSMSLKEKLQVVLNQRGQFACPDREKTVHAPTVDDVAPSALEAVVANLKARGKARPRRVATLTSTIKALAHLNLTDEQVAVIIELLKASGKITVAENQVAYAL